MEANALMASGCSRSDGWIGACETSAKVTRDSVDLRSETTSPGASGGGSAPGTKAGTGTGTGTGTTAPKPPDPNAIDRDEFWVTDPFTLSDLESFVPQAGSDGMEPGGWTIVGLETNFYATTRQHVVNGELAGEPASVRFTPVAWHWDYGDGSSATRGAGGASWAALGIPEFERTPTSHVFRATGSYAVTLTVDFSAEYRLEGGSWVAVDGTLPMSVQQHSVRVSRADTVLVS